MNNTNNQFIDDDGLSKFTSLTHLLNNDNNTDTGDLELMKHSLYFLIFKDCNLERVD